MSDTRGPLFVPAGRYTINLSHVVMSEKGDGEQLDVTVSQGRVVALNGDDARHFNAILSSQIPVGWRQAKPPEDVDVRRLKPPGEPEPGGL